MSSVGDLINTVINRGARLVGVHPPPGPAGGLWSWKYLNKLKTLKLVMNPKIKAIYKAFPDTAPPGSEFPHFVLETTEGETIDTAAFRGQKHFVLFTGAIT